MRWKDFGRRGRWTHSCLYDDVGNYLAQCFPKYLSDNSSKIICVLWDTENGYRGQANDRRTAKREVRNKITLDKQTQP